MAEKAARPEKRAAAMRRGRRDQRCGARTNEGAPQRGHLNEDEAVGEQKVTII